MKAIKKILLGFLAFLPMAGVALLGTIFPRIFSIVIVTFILLFVFYIIYKIFDIK